MRRPFAIAAIVSALALAGCSQDPPERASDEKTPAPAASESPAELATGSEEAEEAPDTGGYVSAYTDFDLAACRVTGEDPEGASVDYACPGREGVPVFVHLGDGRFDLDVGVKGDEFTTIGAFNELGDRLEWRMRDGAAFAVIFRYRDVAPGSGGRTVLGVEKIGRDGAAGCRIAHVAGDTSDANGVAREIADARAAAFRCGADETAYIGDSR